MVMPIPAEGTAVRRRTSLILLRRPGYRGLTTENPFSRDAQRSATRIPRGILVALRCASRLNGFSVVNPLYPGRLNRIRDVRRRTAVPSAGMGITIPHAWLLVC